MQSLTLGLGVGLSCVSGSRYLLNYDFTKGFPAALTHTRASGATVVDESGNVVWADENLYGGSDDVWSGDYSPINLVETGSLALANGRTMRGFAGAVGTANKYMDMRETAFAFQTGMVLTTSFDVAKGSVDYCYVQENLNSAARISYINLTDGSIVSKHADHTILIEDEGDFYRVHATYTVGNAPTGFEMVVGPSNGSTTNPTGDGSTVMFYLGRPQLSRAGVHTYYETTLNNHYFAPRITHDAAGNALGYLHEPQVTNHVLSSLDAFGTGTVKVGAAVTDTGSVVSPSGATDAKEVTVSGANYLRHSVTLVAETAYVWSFWAKKGTATTLKTSVYNISGSAEISGIGLYDYTSQVSTDEWTRIEIPFTTPAGCTSVGVYSTRGSSDGTFFIWGAQVEEGTAATSLIPTFGAEATRQADAVADYVVAGLSAVDSFTLLMKYSPLSDARQALFGLQSAGGPTSYVYWDAQRNATQSSVVDRNDPITHPADFHSSRSADVANMRAAFSYSSSLRLIDVNGGGATASSSTSLSTSAARGIDRLTFGDAATNTIAKSVRLFGKSKTAAELATLTT